MIKPNLQTITEIVVLEMYIHSKVNLNDDYVHRSNKAIIEKMMISTIYLKNNNVKSLDIPPAISFRLQEKN